VAIRAPGVSQHPRRRLQQHPDHRWARPRLGSAAAAEHGDGSSKLVGAVVLGPPVATSGSSPWASASGSEEEDGATGGSQHDGGEGG
jgi:hypothetical protein